MKLFPISFRRSLTATLAGLMLIPASVSVFSLTDSQARGIAVRGPRGGAVAARGVGVGVRAPVRRPVVVAPARGVVRRTTRRTVRRTTRRIYSLPYGYTTRVIGGVSYYYAAGLYYEAMYQGSTVVYVEVEFDD